jgi:hypothetical protein
MTTRQPFWVLPVLIGLAMSGSAQDVTYNFDASADFSKYKTYMWGETNADARPDELMDRQIKAAIEGQLASKGLAKRDQGIIDMVVTYRVRMSQEKQVNAYVMSGWYWGGGMGTMTTSTINVGTLVFDMYDVSSRRLVWRGYAQKTLNPSKNPEKNQKRMQKAMAKLLKNYPPKKK